MRKCRDSMFPHGNASVVVDFRFFGFAGRTNIGTGVGQTWAKFGT